MNFTSWIRVAQWRPLTVSSDAAFVIPLIEPLFSIDTHMSFEERLKLFEIAQSLAQGFVAGEIGSYYGASTAFLAAAASFRSGHVHAVDTWQNHAMPHDGGRDTFSEFLANTKLFRHHITTHRGFAAEMKGRVPMLDLLFIDGDHSYEGVTSDLNNFVPRLKPSCILALHDYHMDSVSTAVRDFFKDRKLDDLGCTHSLQLFHV